MVVKKEQYFIQHVQTEDCVTSTRIRLAQHPGNMFMIPGMPTCEERKQNVTCTS